MNRRLLARAALLGGLLLLHGCSGETSAPSLTMPTTATHARFFPIAPGDVHALGSSTPPIDCNSCHAEWYQANGALALRPSASFHTFTCTSCHVQAPTYFHDDVPALAAFHEASPAVAAITAKTGQPFDTHDQACRACHPQGIRDAVDHGLHFPLPHGDGAGVVVAKCGDCHVARGTGNYLTMGCAPCHARTAPVKAKHAGVVDFLEGASTATQAEQDAASDGCVRCHGDGTVAVRVANHAAQAKGFPIGAGQVHDGPNTSCFACHPARSSNPDKALAGDFKVSSCVSCHAALVGPADIAHDDRATLDLYHSSIVDRSLNGAVPIEKARLFGQVVAAATAAAGGDAARGLSAACLQCHPQGIGGHPYYLLPHRNAARTVEARCADCHVTDGRRADLGCAACHARTSPVAAKHARVPDVLATDTSLAASARCARCHEYDAIPTRVATHGPFTIASGKHAGAAGGVCLSCHDALKGEPTPWAADFKKTNCVGCHVAVAGGTAQHDDWASLRPIHAGVALYPTTQPTPAAFAAACLQCHPTGTSGLPADHGDYFSVAAGSKHAFPGPRITTCLDCHTSANRLDPSAFRCAACHANDAVPLATGHAKVPDYALDPQNPVKCLACHADGRLPATTARITVTVNGHGVAANGFTIGSGTHAGAAGGQCLVCHPANRAPSTTPPHWDYARDFKQSNCTGCHVAVGGGLAWHDDKPAAGDGKGSLASIHSAASGFTTTVASMGLSAACVRCHPDGAGGAPANHPQLFPIAAGTKHAGIACGSCHTNPANRKDLTAFACYTCHSALPAVTGGRKAWSAAHAITGYTITSYKKATTAGDCDKDRPTANCLTVNVDMTKPEGCLRCHADGQVNRVAAHPLGDSGFGEADHRRAGCYTCHWRLRTDKPWGILFKPATGTAAPPTACYVCHASGRG